MVLQVTAGMAIGGSLLAAGMHTVGTRGCRLQQMNRTRQHSSALQGILLTEEMSPSAFSLQQARRLHWVPP